MIEILQQYAVFGFILLLVLAYLLGTKKANKNLEEKICGGIDEHSGYKKLCDTMKKLDDSLFKVGQKVKENTSFKENHQYDITRLENKIRQFEKGTTPEESEDIELLKQEVKKLKKQLKKLMPDKEKEKIKTI